MIKLNIEIDKSNVLLEVGRLTNYIGKKKNKDDGKYETIGAISADDTMLEQFWFEGVDAICNELKAFDAKTDIGETLSAECYMSEWWDLNNSKNVNDTIRMFLVNYIVSRWLMFTMNFDDSEQYDGVANRSMTKLIEFLYTTSRPAYKTNFPAQNE